VGLGVQYVGRAMVDQRVGDFNGDYALSLMFLTTFLPLIVLANSIFTLFMMLEVISVLIFYNLVTTYGMVQPTKSGIRLSGKNTPQTADI